MPRYDAQRIEPKWQQFWEREQTFRVEPDTAKSKLYVLDMFPYPSAAGLHVGHPEGYTATDITSRYQRMRGKAVLHPMGWDAFGLPAEEHAVKTGKHPRLTTEENINNFRRQLKMLGFSYDWSREISTTDPDYYRWTQWIFLQLFDAWYDAEHVWTGPDGVTRTGKGRPIAELPIPEDVNKQGTNAVRRYQDKHRLAYQHEAAVNWCPGLGTVLANEEVIDGKSERGGHPVERRPLRQWMLRITSYADRLSEELESLNWPESIKVLQRNWIGRSEGAEVDFRIVGAGEATFGEWKTTRKESGFPKEAPADVIRVYTTRPDTLFGATYMVLAPEHPLVPTLTTDKQKAAVEAYQKQASLKSDLDRTDLAKEKTGVFTGGYALNPVNGEPVPVWIADYVLSSYGTGAIMAVPAHDERDFEFATQFKIPVVPVVRSSDGSEVDGKPFTGEGVAINSGGYDGTPTRELKSRIAADLAAQGLGETAVNYRLRDWLFSRQRYWGEPFPIWHELDEDGQPTGLLRTDAEADLPVTLPEMADFKPTGTPEPLLSKAPESWLYKTSGDGVRLKRETNSMPQWAGSCWYYLRFCSPKYGQRFIDPEAEKYWLPVDLYIGGAEHAVLHLLYSRFWHKVLFDLGHVTHPEPFGRLVNQGMILGEMEFHAYRDPATSAWVTLADAKKRMDAQDDSLVPVKLTVEQVEKRGDQFVLSADRSIVIDARSFKMSKSRQNVVNPDDVVKAYGADSLRLYEMFMGPLEATKPWSTTGVEGVYRFLGRVWRMVIDERDENVRLAAQVQDVPPTHDQLRLLHKTIQSVTDDVEKLSYNTAISRMMEFVNEMTSAEVRPKSVIETFVLLLNPFAPHLAEELWEALGRTESLSYAPWPAVNAEYLVESEVEIPVQFNGKLKGKVKVPAGSDAQTQQTLAAAAPDIAAQLEGKTIVKTVSVPGKMVNFVVR